MDQPQMKQLKKYRIYVAFLVTEQNWRKNPQQ